LPTRGGGYDTAGGVPNIGRDIWGWHDDTIFLKRRGAPTGEDKIAGTAETTPGFDVAARISNDHGGRYINVMLARRLLIEESRRFTARASIL
jgi:hypothetical protein